MTYGSSARPDLPLAVVIGAGGMGMAVARRLAQSYRVLLADINQTHVETQAALLRQEGSDCTAISCDVTSVESVANLAAAVEGLGGVRVLAHVAGLSPSAGDFHAILRVNLTGVAQVAEALRPYAGQGSAAIAIASLAAHGPAPDEDIIGILRHPVDPSFADRLAEKLGPDLSTPASAYALSKWGVVDYCRRNAALWGECGARILSLSPGIIATPMGALEFERSEGKRKMFAATPLKREGTMLEIADAVEFLASPRASFISGTDLLVDGGLAAALSSR